MIKAVLEKTMIKPVLAFLGLSIAMLMFALLFKQASSIDNFQEQYQRLATAELDGDQLQINQLRDFRYFDDGTIKSANYRQANYSLRSLKQVWYGISHFGPMGLAHVFMSFEFDDGQYLVVSIEARLKNNESYSPGRGLFRYFAKTIVLSSEQDVIGLRSHIRKNERLFLYPLQLTELQQQALLLDFLRAANALAREPEFYNTLFDNCMVGLLAETYEFRYLRYYFNPNILLPGNSDKFLLEKGLLAWRGDINDLRKKAYVDGIGYSIDDADYSKKIRGIKASASPLGN